jgi:tRNA (guanine6-N2)-methyltransferase
MLDHAVGSGQSRGIVLTIVSYGIGREMATFAAFVTRGLEDIAAAEITASSNGIRPLETRPKVVMAHAEDPRAFSHLRTVDDIAIVSAQSASVEDLEDLSSLIADGGDLERSIEIARRADRLDGAFSVTVSAAHAAYGPASVIEEAAARAISMRYRWQHVQFQRAPIDVRVFIDGTWALIGVRLLEEPLSRRSYRVANARGALRPTVAAALVRIATPGKRKQQVWDPFCGSGTIICEAASLGHEVWGTDIDPEAVEAARENISSVKREYWGRIENGNSTSLRTWQKHRSATAVISNLPWGKQVAITSKQALYDCVASGVADLGRRGGTGVLLTTEPKAIMQRLQRVGGLSIDERRIGLLGQTPAILIIRSAG